MKRWLSFMLSAVLVSSLSACSAVDLNTPKSEELSKQYDYYEESTAEIRTEIGVTPEQADEIFLVLLSVGVDGKATISKNANTDNTYSVYWVGGLDSCTFEIADGVLVEARDDTFNDNILYPLDRATATVSKTDLDDVVSKIDALNDDSTSSDYESAQSAFDFLTVKLQKKISKEQSEKLASFSLRFSTIEQAVDSAIENARAEKDKVVITENASTEDTSDVIVSVYLKGSDNLTNNMVRSGMLMQASDILEQLQLRSDISMVALFWSFPLVDIYGNTEEENVMKIQLDGDSLRNINFQGFDRNNFSIIANDYFEHPALSAK